eukprot:1185098-Prorocentrum_minimum.AAC.2
MRGRRERDARLVLVFGVSAFYRRSIGVTGAERFWRFGASQTDLTRRIESLKEELHSTKASAEEKEQLFEQKVCCNNDTSNTNVAALTNLVMPTFDTRTHASPEVYTSTTEC